MRALSSAIAALLFAAPPAMSQSKWLESGRLERWEVSELCGRTGDVRSLARAQMTTTGPERWRQLSRQQLTVEAFVLGTPPMDPGRCYIVARAGLGEDTERRLFEVRDFIVNAESTSVFVVGRNFALPLKSGEPTR
ncbi:hypothetical protein QM467_18625 [Rhodoblastus sp. 17X3]|uniref:hypothetical protein n=1 Tax=Rhodoblastus sp. 17X3 TaxID=3047026 RepID=UPI0024B7E568|nr:hypothetical protein [Rhodoblastus sp. 17X3]MDI9850054.1 hypothetical protein [Rhodoblastus sp. 17X3]